MIFLREYNLQHVNHSLAEFLPNGIRKFLLDHTMAFGLRGRVSRDYHDLVHIVLEGKKHELAKMKAVIDDLRRRTVVGEIVPFCLNQAIEDYNYDSFEISPNLHNRCVKNARSAGDQWEKKFSSKGSDQLVLVWWIRQTEEVLFKFFAYRELLTLLKTFHTTLSQ